MIWSRRRRAVVLAGLLLAGCAHYPVNAKIEPGAASAHRFPDAPADGTNLDSLFVCLTFSGGGTRAAALAYGVLDRLRTTEIVWDGRRTSLLDEVDCISSVSGGSFTAAYYGLFRERLFTSFRDRFLLRNIERELVLGLFNPVTLWRLASPTWSRSDLAAELYDRTVFEGRTFADLAGRRPFVILNATDYATGNRFEFTQDQFDVLGSDLARYPVARGVAASSAFPILLAPISVVNHPQPAGYRPPQEYVNAARDYYNNRRRWAFARSRTDYLDKDRRPFVHLGDGGMADNIGLRPLDAAYHFASGFLRQRINQRRVTRLVVIVVNARTEPQERISRRERPPGALNVLFKTTSIAMDNYSFETIELMRDVQKEALQVRQYVRDCQELLGRACPAATLPVPPPPPLRTCVVEVTFEALRDDAQRRRFLEMPTTFQLPRQDVEDLVALGGRLLDESPDFQRLLRSLGGTPPSAAPGDDPNCS